MSSTNLYKKTFCILIIIIYYNFAQSQSFRELIFEADSLHNEELYSSADSVYDIAFDKNDNVLYGFLYNAALNNVKANNYIKAIDQIIKSINIGFIDFETIFMDDNLIDLRKNENWIKVENVISEKEKKLNRDFIIKLEKLRQKDQLFRTTLNCTNQLSKVQQEILSDISHSLDSLNVIELVTLINLHGSWLGIDVVGYEGNLTSWLIIQHAEVELQENYLPLLKESVLNNNSNAEHYAMMYDRILLSKGFKQSYGTQIKRNKESGKFYVYPIENKEQLLQRRNSIGLQPINEYLQRWGITIEKDYVNEIKYEE